MKKHLPATILSLLLTAPLLIHAQEPASCEFNYGTYTDLSPSYIEVIDYASGMIDNKIYLTCGWASIPGTPHATPFYEDLVSVYDPGTDTWDTTGTRIPVARAMYGAGNTALNGKLYVIGGVEWLPESPYWRIIPLARVDVYDPGSDQWEQKANLPIPIGLCSRCSLNGKIYVTGGQSTDEIPLNTLYSYDPDSDAWTELASMTTPRFFHVTLALDGKIYVISGDDSEGPGGGTKTCEVYDPQTDQWSSIAPLPVVNLFAAACAMDGEIYVFGGDNDWDINPYSDVYKYNPQSDTWITIDQMPVGLENHVALPIEREIYLMGGADIDLTIHPPVRVFTLSDIRLDAMIPDDTINGDAIEVDLSGYFSHVDGGEITFSVCMDPDILQASVDGNMLTVTGLLPGEAKISVLAESGEDQMGDTFQVHVQSTGINDKCVSKPRLHIYPNPARGTTTLEISVESAGVVRLDVYDLLGKRVAIPLNEHLVPGVYEHQLNPAGLESGIYICELSTATERVTAKLIVEQ